MPPLARRNLFHDKVRLTVTLTGIVFAVVLIVVELGLFVGFTSTTSGLVDHSGADLWVASKNVPYIEQGVAFSERRLNQVRAIQAWAKLKNTSRIGPSGNVPMEARNRFRSSASMWTPRWAGHGI